MKYPRTYHLPWSPGTTSDDRKLSSDWFKYYKDKEVIITEKMDGEGIHFTHYDVFARSDGAPTRSDWSRNLWDKNGILWEIKNKIGETEQVFGENLYGEHSIHYNKLTNYFLVFGACDIERNIFYSWDDVKTVAECLNLNIVPELWKGTLKNEEELVNLIDKFMHEPSTYGDEKEGIVMRVIEEFPINEFSHCVCKWVRPGHVTTGEHWTKNWKRAKLIWEYNENEKNL